MSDLKEELRIEIEIVGGAAVEMNRRQ